MDGTLDVFLGGVARPMAPVDDSDEPPLPEEAVHDLLVKERAPTQPVQAGAGQSLHIHFRSLGQDAVVGAFRMLREIFHEHPGETPVVLHVPAGAGRSQRMELRLGVAYDTELVALIGRRIGEGSVELSLAG